MINNHKCIASRCGRSADIAVVTVRDHKITKEQLLCHQHYLENDFNPSNLYINVINAEQPAASYSLGYIVFDSYNDSHTVVMISQTLKSQISVPIGYVQSSMLYSLMSQPAAYVSYYRSVVDIFNDLGMNISRLYSGIVFNDNNIDMNVSVIEILTPSGRKRYPVEFSEAIGFGIVLGQPVIMGNDLNSRYS